MKHILVNCLLALGSSCTFAAEFSYSGFGTLSAGVIVDGDGYIADFPNLGVYEDGLDFGQETRLGFQATAVFDSKLSATLQAMTRAANDFKPEVEWLYATYNTSENTNIQAGRMRMPVYYFSEYMDVGFAYPWVRIPADTYSLDVTNFNGIKFNYRFNVGSSDLLFSAYTGKENNPNDELMSYLFESFTTQIDRKYEDIFGIVLDWSLNGFSARVTQTQANMQETQHYFDGTTGVIPYDAEFFDIFLRYDFESNISIMTEYNEDRPFYKSYFVSTTYQADSFLVYVSWSQFDLDEPFEKHDTTSVGLRFDIGDGYAAKVDLSTMNDEGFNPFSGLPNPVYHADPDGNGDVSILSFSLDFLF